MNSGDIGAAYNRGKWALILRGVVGIGVGVLILSRPLESVAAFALVIALWALIDGVVRIVHAFDLRPVIPHWWVMLLAGIVSAVFGAAALYYYPALSLAFAVAWTAWWLITGGALAFYVALREKASGISWGWTMVFAIIALGVGVIAIIYPGVTISALMGLIAAFGIISGIVMLVAAGKMRSFQHRVKEELEQPPQSRAA